MAKRIWLISTALAIMGVVCPTTTFAKPGDLPVDITQQCPDARESVAEGWTAPDGDCLAARPRAGADAAPCLRSNQPIARDNSPRPVNQARGTHHRVRREAHVPPIAPHDAEAARLLALGERCRQIGDHAQAAVCFEEAHLVSPTSIAGRLAIDRLREMELERFGGPRGAAEEAEIPAFVQPQRPVIEPRDVSGPRPPARQPGASPERQPQLPPVPTPSRPRELQKLKEMLDSTVPLGGAEEQETTRQGSDGSQQLVESNKAVPVLDRDSIEEVLKEIRELRFASGAGRSSTPAGVNQPFLPFMVWTRAELVTDWVTATIYARMRMDPTYQSFARGPASACFPSPAEPGNCDPQAEREWWSTGIAYLFRPENGEMFFALSMAPAAPEEQPFKLLPLCGLNSFAIE